MPPEYLAQFILKGDGAMMFFLIRDIVTGRA
jgi:hypothetical protein